MKHLSLLALIACSVACAPVDDAELPGTGANAEAASYTATTPACTSPTICYDTGLITPSGGSCRTPPSPVSCTYNRTVFEPTSKPSRACNVATDCRRVDLRQVGPIRAVAVNVNSLAAVQSWHQANCGGAILASNNVVTDDGAVSGTVVMACCNNACVTKR
ncbi:MAG: hypothetical protein U0324_00695 [Polyangiales bacterium]